MTKDNEKIPSAKDDPKVVQPGDGGVPNELPHHRKLLDKHAFLERNASALLVGAFLVVTVGGIVEIAPLFWLENTIENVEGVRPYSPLELAGREIYVREGCYVCHSQMIRPMRDEVERYGHYSLAAESKYDHPFQWGSKRTGPDLARVGGRYSDEWHVDHLYDPQTVVPELVMPKYDFLARADIGPDYIEELLETQRLVGVPYTDEMIASAPRRLRGAGGPDGRLGRAARALSRRADPQLRRAGGADRDGCADRLSADARHAGRFLDLRSRRRALRRTA